jgi:two-component system, cell cycle sensor histidine kinase and response regulator CckA
MPVVLIVEDEVAVRVVAERILKGAGHEILSAGSVTDALAIIHSKQRFDLLFTDMKLGEDVEGGVRVSEGIAESRPGLPVLYTSGGAITDDTRSKFVEPRTFLPKPYSRDQLVQAVLDLTRAIN